MTKKIGLKYTKVCYDIVMMVDGEPLKEAHEIILKGNVPMDIAERRIVKDYKGMNVIINTKSVEFIDESVEIKIEDIIKLATGGYGVFEIEKESDYVEESGE